ncbi:MAG: hypothetical protein RL670_157 [Actinomycetota bacterium]
MSATIIQFPVRSTWSKARVYRLARTAIVAVALLIGASQLLLGQASAGAASNLSNGHFNYVTVMPGDSLWGIAEKAAPGQNTGDYVQAIISLNNLGTANVSVGQQLALPN